MPGVVGVGGGWPLAHGTSDTLGAVAPNSVEYFAASNILAWNINQTRGAFASVEIGGSTVFWTAPLIFYSEADPSNVVGKLLTVVPQTGEVDQEVPFDTQGAGGRAPVPEPATMLLVGIGLAGLAGLGRKKFRN